ncbi:MAG: hypothetical protein ACRENM_08615 [Candidatus Dormibacteraceae bacterium]
MRASPTARPAHPPACEASSRVEAAPLGPTASGTLWTIATGLDQPDDLLFVDGALMVAVLGSGRIEAFAAGLAPAELPVHIPAVEGMAMIGTQLYAAGQIQDVVDRVTGAQVTSVLQLNPVPGQDGVDGIGTQGGALIVPDSPRGLIDWVDPETGHIIKQIGGFVRPTGVWAAADGSLLVADEYGNAAIRIGPDGARSYLARNLPIVDDIAQDSVGAVFVVTPAASGGRLVQLLGNGTRDLADHLQAPQGLTVDQADNLYLSEEDAGRVDLLIRTFKLTPLSAISDSATQPICIDVQRATGFSGPIELHPSSGLQVVQQPGVGSRGAILVTGCRNQACQLIASSGARSDLLWIRAQG